MYYGILARSDGVYHSLPITVVYMDSFHQSFVFQFLQLCMMAVMLGIVSCCFWRCHHEFSYCKSLPGSLDECRLHQMSLPKLKPSHLTWTVSPPVLAVIHIHCHNILLLLSLKPDTDVVISFPSNRQHLRYSIMFVGRSRGKIIRTVLCCIMYDICALHSNMQFIHYYYYYYYYYFTALWALSWTARVSRYQEGKTNLDFTEASDSEWQWHQFGHMQICTSPQTDNHASTPPLDFFYRPNALPAAQPTV